MVRQRCIYLCRKDPSGSIEVRCGQLSQGYNPSYATVYKHHEIPYVKYEAECTSRDDGSAASDAVVSDVFFDDGMLFRPDDLYHARTSALLKVHVTSETRGISQMSVVFEVGNTKGTVSQRP